MGIKFLLKKETKMHTRCERGHLGGLQRYKDGMRKTKALGDLDLVKGGKNGSYRCIVSTKKAKKNMGLLLRRV